MKEVEVVFKPERCDYIDGDMYCVVCTSKFYLTKVYKLLLDLGNYKVKELNSDDFVVSKKYNGFTPIEQITDEKRYLHYKTDKSIKMFVILYNE